MTCWLAGLLVAILCAPDAAGAGADQNCRALDGTPEATALWPEPAAPLTGASAQACWDSAGSSSATIGLNRILGPSVGRFLLNGWTAGKWIHLPAGGARFAHRFVHLWSLSLAQHIVHSRSAEVARVRNAPLEFGAEIKLVISGESLKLSNGKVYDGMQAKWSHVRTGFAAGATLVLNKVETHNPVLYALCVELEKDLVGSWVDANAYITPPNSTGFAPHYDSHDALILQAEGTKTWSVCQRLATDHLRARRKYEHRSKPPINFFSPGEIKGCQEVLMAPGDVLYLPEGTVHSAMAGEATHSTHITLGVSRFEFSWASFLPDLGNPGDNEKLGVMCSAFAKTAPELRATLPLMAQFVQAGAYEDLPDGLKTLWRAEAARHLGRHKALAKKLGSGAKTDAVWERAIELMLQRVHIGSLAPIAACIALPIPRAQTRMHALFRRVPGARAAIVVGDAGGGKLAVATGGFSGAVSRAWYDGLLFVLGMFKDNTSRGRPFTVGQLATSMKDPQEAIPLLGWLLERCVVEKAVSPS